MDILPRHEGSISLKNFVSAMAFAILFAVSANAQIVRDQYVPVEPDFAGGMQINLPPHLFGTSYVESGRIVTVGKAGLLASVDVAINSDVQGTANLRIRSLTAGTLVDGNTNILGSLAFNTTPWVDFGVYTTSNIDVRSLGLVFGVGDQFALTFDAATPNFIGWGNARYYDSGPTFYRTGPTADWQLAGTDVGFATYVDTSYAQAVPEPASWAMMLTGFALVGGLARRRAATACSVA
jgi:hypothetical protein